MKKCPCRGCICMPICRNKGYLKLVYGCELVSLYLGTPCEASKKRNYPLRVLHKLFKPTSWYLENGDLDFHPYDRNILMVRRTDDSKF